MTYEQKTAARIARRNDPEHIKTRLTLRFSLCYFAAFLGGILLCRLLPTGVRILVDRLALLALSSPIPNGAIARDAVRAVLASVGPELILLALVTASGMTMCSAPTCRAWLSCHALLFGVFGYAAALQAATHAGRSSFFLIGFLTQLAYAAVLLFAAVEAVVFSDRYRQAYHGLRHQRDALAVHHLLTSLACGGTMVTVATLSALLLALAEKI